MSNYKTETKCIQSGYEPGNGEARVLPIYQSTTFRYTSSEQMGRLFDLEESGYFYTRLQNPTNDAVAAKICDLEGGVAAMLTSSGQAANFYAIMNIVEAGDHIVCASALYGGTYNLYAHTIKKMGVEATFVDPECTQEELDAAFQENTKAVFGETIANPALVVLDLEKFANAAHAHGVPFIDGHAACVGGAIVDSGNFDWEVHKEKFPGLTTPDETYHGIVYTEKFGKGAYITKATAQLMRDLGSIQSPQNAFLLNIGLETLHLRVPRHCENAVKVAEYLKNHEKVAWVRCPSLPGDKYYDLAQKYMPNGTCGVITFGLKGGRDAAVEMMDRLKMVAIVTHVADARSCVLHPASHTHRQMNDKELVEAGVQPDLIRFSVGIENIEDIIADVEQALR